MRKLTLMGVLGILLPLFSIQAQEIKPLHIGDTMPDLVLHNVINYKDSIIRLSDFKDKLVILDFWGTWCQPCIDLIPVLENLQVQFKEKLQVLLLTSQSRDIVAPFLSKRKINLPSVVNDTLFSKVLFPHNYVPHEIWIKNGRVFAVTGQSELKEENIRAVINGNIDSFEQKKSNFKYDINMPLLIDGNGGGTQDDLLFHSIFTRYLDGIGGGGIYLDSLHRFKIRALNGCVLDLYQIAFRYAGNVSLTYSNRNIIEASCSKKLIRPNIPEYYPAARDNFYCYELIVPARLKEKVPTIMLDDLNRFFGTIYNIHGCVEKRKVKCWVLKKKGNTAKLLSKSAVPLTISHDDMMIYQKQPFKKFFAAMEYIFRKQDLPLINKTNITADIDITFPTNVTDIVKFKDRLQKYELYMDQEMCTIDMLVIKNILTPNP